MAKFKKRRKMGKFGRILAFVLCGALIIGALGSVVAFAQNDTKSAGAIFKVGGLDETTGKYIENDQTIYTEKAIDAYGLRIEPDFESTVTYDIFYYDGEDKLLKVVKGLTDVYDEDFELAAKCRIVIHPEIPDDVKEKDFKVRFYEVAKYSSMLKITNSKESNGIIYENLIDYESFEKGYALTLDYDSDGKPILPNIFEVSNNEDVSNFSLSPVLEIEESIDGVVFFVKCDFPPSGYVYFYIANEDGQCVDTAVLSSSSILSLDNNWHMFKLSESSIEEAKYVRVCLDYSIEIDEIYMYGYND